MSITPGVYNIILNTTGKPNVVTLGKDGVDLITPASDSASKWIIRPISDVPANAYTIQNESTNNATYASNLAVTFLDISTVDWNSNSSSTLAVSDTPTTST